MSRKQRIDSPLAYWGCSGWDLYHTDRPRIPREWLEPALLKAALANYFAEMRAEKLAQGLSLTSEDYMESVPMVQQPNFPDAPISPNEANAWLSHLRWNRDCVEKLKTFGVSELDALEALYTHRWALGRYACDAENAKKFLIESKAIDRGSVDPDLWDELKHEWAVAARKGDRALMDDCATIADRLLALEKTLPWEKEHYDQRLCHFASGARRELYSLHVLDGWVIAYAENFQPNRVHPDDWDEARGEPKRDANGDYLCRVPLLERPAFVDADAWEVPLCLWDDRALARFCGMSDRNARAFRKASELVNETLELSRPPIVWVKLDRASERIIRLEKPHARRVRRDILRKKGQKVP